MVNKFLSTFGAMALFALLVSFGARGPEPAAKVRTPAKAIADIPITHHFSQFLGPVGSFDGSSAEPPLSATMPADSGLAISQLTDAFGQNGWSVVIRVQGNPVFKSPLPSGTTMTLTPPIIVPPGALLELGIEPGPGPGSPGGLGHLTIAGYTLDAAYFGGP